MLKTLYPNDNIVLLLKNTALTGDKKDETIILFELFCAELCFTTHLTVLLFIIKHDIIKTTKG